MKKSILIFTYFITTILVAQKKIAINTEMFVQIIFETSIQSVKTGAPDLVLTDFEDNSLNIQSLKGYTELDENGELNNNNFKTNISVKTTDGLFFSFIVENKPNIDKLFYNVERKQAMNFKNKIYTPNKSTSSKKNNSKQVITNKTIVDKIIEEKGYIRNRNTKKYKKIFFSIRGVYVEKEKLYFLFNIKNKSNINYKIDNISFVSVPISNAKRKVNSEGKECRPLFFYKSLDNIASKTNKNIVAVFNKFTINNEKKLEVTLSEVNGERTIKLIINSKFISDARKI